MLRRRWRERILAYHEGETSPAERAAVEAHLHGCAACRDLMSKLEDTDTLLLRSRPVVETLPPAVSQVILAQAQARSAALRPPGRRTWGVWTFAASALCLFAAGTAGMYRPPLPDGDAAPRAVLQASVKPAFAPPGNPAPVEAMRKMHREARGISHGSRRRVRPGRPARAEAPSPLPTLDGYLDEGARALADAALGYPGEARRMTGSLVASVASAEPPSLELAVEVKELPEEAPGQACASSALQDAYGRITQKDVKVTDSGAEPQVVLVGSTAETSPTN